MSIRYERMSLKGKEKKRREGEGKRVKKKERNREGEKGTINRKKREGEKKD